MKPKRILTILTLSILIIFLTLSNVSNSLAQTGSGFDLTWNVIGGGGSQGMAGNGYTLDSTTGQNVVAASSGSGFTLKHGFWALWELLRSYLPITVK